MMSTAPSGVATATVLNVCVVLSITLHSAENSVPSGESTQ